MRKGEDGKPECHHKTKLRTIHARNLPRQLPRRNIQCTRTQPSVKSRKVSKGRDNRRPKLHIVRFDNLQQRLPQRFLLDRIVCGTSTGQRADPNRKRFLMRQRPMISDKRWRFPALGQRLRRDRGHPTRRNIAQKRCCKIRWRLRRSAVLHRPVVVVAK